VQPVNAVNTRAELRPDTSPVGNEVPRRLADADPGNESGHDHDHGSGHECLAAVRIALSAIILKGLESEDVVPT